MGEAWRDGLHRQVEDLGRWFAGRFVPAPEPTDELIPARSLLDRDTLRAAIERSATTTMRRSGSAEQQLPDPDLRIVASRFTRHYTNPMTVVALAGLSHGIGLDLSADRCTLVVRHGLPWSLALDVGSDEVLRCAERQATWPVGGPVVGTLRELRDRVWQTLYAGHVRPLLDAAIGLGSVPAGVVWTNAAEWPTTLRQAAVEYLEPPYARRLADECTAVLEAPRLPGMPGEANPLTGRLESMPGDGNGFPETVQTRKLCCLTYLLPDRFGRLCQSCPYLPLEERIALVRERHGVPMAQPGGPAEQRSIERGLERPSTRRILARQPEPRPTAEGS